MNISLYDISGKKVRIIIKESKQRGTHSLMFRRKDLPAGVYFIRMQSSDNLKIVKLIILD